MDWTNPNFKNLACPAPLAPYKTRGLDKWTKIYNF